MPAISKQQPTSKGKTSPSSQSAWDLAEGIKVLLYGQSKSGKTTLCATFPKPILALIVSGGNKPGELKSIDTPENRKTIHPKVVSNTDLVRTELDKVDNYATLVLDHVSGLQDLVLKEILGIDKIPEQKGWGLASMQQYGQCTMQCKEMLRSMLNFNGNVVIIGQERTFGGSEDGVSSEIITPTVGVAVTPSLAGWLNPAVDYILQTFKRPNMVDTVHQVAGKSVTTTARGKGVQYCLRTAPHDVYITGFRAVKGTKIPDSIVDPSYDKIMDVINGKAK